MSNKVIKKFQFVNALKQCTAMNKSKVTTAISNVWLYVSKLTVGTKSVAVISKICTNSNAENTLRIQ
jgi:hypothetical protein